MIALLFLVACSDDPGESGASGGATMGTGGLGTSSGGGALPGVGGPTSGGAPASGGVQTTGGTANVGSGGLSPAGGSGGIGGVQEPGGLGGIQNTGGNIDATGGTGNAGAFGGAGNVGTGGGAGNTTCPSPALASGDTNRTVQVGSTSRTYVLHVPAAYDGSRPVPLVVDFHPLGGSGPAERSGSPYPAQTDPEGVIMAFPSGQPGPRGGAWNVGPCCVAGVDDVAFARALVQDIEGIACIDRRRVYAVGFSMGGGMSHYLACHAADLFAAVSPAAFDLLEENAGDCTPPRPISVVSFRGTSDNVVPYEGGYSAVVTDMPVTFLGARRTFEKWAQVNQCTGSPSAQDGQGCSTYSNCQGGTEVVLCTKQGGGHEPGNASIGWPLLKRHTLP